MSGEIHRSEIEKGQSNLHRLIMMAGVWRQREVRDQVQLGHEELWVARIWVTRTWVAEEVGDAGDWAWHGRCYVDEQPLVLNGVTYET